MLETTKKQLNIFHSYLTGKTTNELYNIRTTDGTIVGDLQIGSDGFIELAFVVLIKDEKTNSAKSYIYKLKKSPAIPHMELKTNDDLMSVIIEETDKK